MQDVCNDPPVPAQILSRDALILENVFLGRGEQNPIPLLQIPFYGDFC